MMGGRLKTGTGVQMISSFIPKINKRGQAGWGNPIFAGSPTVFSGLEPKLAESSRSFESSGTGIKPSGKPKNAGKWQSNAGKACAAKPYALHIRYRKCLKIITKIGIQ
ncbi:hypothetical protein C7N83_12405 [Neisseria iguanae]|uniref:Uncharacterized protein n=1 Tax=Neisseria iguanae TaxID=90242 RepID=A0A2P7TXG2_9NEIS|nr:hypothetical protein C7N83_12405 [Neisseria iguanae]